MTVTLPYSKGWDALTWAKENCPSYITNTVHMDGHKTYIESKIDYHFGDSKDAMAFILRWS